MVGVRWESWRRYSTSADFRSGYMLATECRRRFGMRTVSDQVEDKIHLQAAITAEHAEKLCLLHFTQRRCFRHLALDIV